MTLTYNLYHQGSEMLTPSIVSPQMTSFKQLLSQAVGSPHFMREGGILGFVCQHKYVFEDLNVASGMLPVTLKGADYYIYLEVQSLGVPVVIKPVINKWQRSYILDHFAPFKCTDACGEDSDAECDYEDLAVQTWFGDSRVDVKVTWCQSNKAAYAQPAAAGVVGSGYYGNEAELECMYQSAAILIGIPRWGKERQALSGRGDSEVVCAKVEGEPGSDREMCVDGEESRGGDGKKGSGGGDDDGEESGDDDGEEVSGDDDGEEESGDDGGEGESGDDDGEEESVEEKAMIDDRYYAKIFGKEWKRFCGN